MCNSLKVAALTVFALVAAGSIAEAASHGQHQTSAKSGVSSQRHVSLHPLKHKTPPSHGTPSSSGPKKVVHLANGPVLFKDTCTKEWAMGTAAPTHAVVAACLRKEYVEGEKVLFKDICTKEWAMNPPVQRAVTSTPDETAPPADKTVAPSSDQQAPAAADEEEEDDDQD